MPSIAEDKKLLQIYIDVVDKPDVRVGIYIVHLANEYPTLVELAAEKDAEITRLRERSALPDCLLGETLRHGYLNERECPPTWLAEAMAAVTDLDKFKDNP
jgi:hypothetical protein